MAGEDLTPSVDVRKIWVPVTLLGALVSGVISVVTAYARINEHVSSPFVHLEPGKVISGGGVAYQRELDALRSDLKWGLVNSQVRFRNALRGATVTCTRSRAAGGCLSWRIDLAESSEDQ